MLILQNVSAGINGRSVLKNVNLKLRRGDLTYIVGPNGAGKSTLMSVISGLTSIQSGSILVDGVKLTKKNRNEYISFVFQDPMLGTFPMLSIYENFLIAEHKGSFFKKLCYAYRNKEFYESYVEKNLGYKINLDKKMSNLSGGQRQVLSILMASLRKNPVWLLDEPFAALDFQKRKQLNQFIQDIVKREKIYALMVTHHKVPQNASYLKMSHGRIVKFFINRLKKS